MAFEDIDTRKARALCLDTFTQALTRLQLGFTAATLRDLFLKSDKDRDGLLSYAEFQWFAESYPTVLDVIYYRSKDYWLDLKQQEGIEQARQKLAELNSREGAAQRAVQAAEQDTYAQEHALDIANHNIQDCEARENDAKSALDRAKHDSEQCRADVRQRVKELNEAREAVRAAQKTLQEAQREVEQQELRITQCDNEVAHAEGRLQEIERMMHEQRRLLDLCLANASKARDELDNAQAREANVKAQVDDAVREQEMLTDNVASAEKVYHQQQEREAVCNTLLRESAGDTARATTKRDAEQRELDTCRANEARATDDHHAVQRMVQSQEAQVTALCDENDGHNQRRAQVQEEERPLLEQEVRLKEQRDCLESKETELRQRFNEYSVQRQSLPAGHNSSISPPMNRAASPSTSYRTPSSAYPKYERQGSPAY